MKEETYFVTSSGDKISCEDVNSHIGLANTNKRLQIIYEEKARLYINSRIGTGTIVTMIIPAYLQEKPESEE